MDEITSYEVIFVNLPKNWLGGHASMGDIALTVPWYLYLLMGKTLGCYFKVLSPYEQAAQCNKKTFLYEIVIPAQKLIKNFYFRIFIEKWSKELKTFGNSPLPQCHKLLIPHVLSWQFG